MAPSTSKNTSTKSLAPKKKTNNVKASAVRQYSQSDHLKGYASAKKAFNEFATKMKTYAYEELTWVIVDDEDYTLEQMMKEFAGFLFFRYPSGGTALQYLSGVKSCLMKDFEDSRWWKPSMRDEKDQIMWYSSIYRTLEFKLADKCHESGRSLYEKPDGVDRSLQDVLWGFRGGWRADLKRGRGNKIEYLSISNFISRAGLSLAGYEFIDEVPYAHSCDAFMNDDTRSI
eukprot:CAMPEP_0178977774 /NCGR_PEP_ID=MMETSP0789-20121207/24722_1 /TAXON_ID=3005 /ORGANISM="Rhizosolenia setigera, Strain CCMP 1694" /LENGTH=228 /DNA_ID=CAMNT_0020667303 /DNA_START=232 /DNA_END=918 /DNA_ORIENTATION=+